MTTDNRLTVSARWDKDIVPAGQSSQRNLLLEITAPPKAESSGSRPRINLALVIDRSGSMRGSRIEAARMAAVGIVNALGEQDRISLVSFDDRIDTLIDGRAMDDIGKREAVYQIEQLHSRGSTNLGAGWYEGARCAAQLVDSGKFSEGYVLVLSDGMANQGICDPDKLLEHAGELAGRGVKTSAIGIGENYSPLQLDALAEGGRGRLHDAETAEDIVEVVLGELGELHAITARDVRVTVESPSDARLDLMTRSSVEHEIGIYRVQLGDIAAGSIRPVAIRVDLPAYELDQLLGFNIIVSWRGSRDQQIPGIESLETQLHVVPPAEVDAQRADRDVVERMATLVEAILAYRAMRLNERRDYAGATMTYEESRGYCENLVAGLPDESARLDRMNRSCERVSGLWDGRSKRQAYTLSKKAMLSERDLRSKDQGEWHDHLDDQS